MPVILHRFHTRLLMAFALTMVIGTLGLALWTSASQSRQLLTTREQQADLTADNLADGSAHAFVIEDYAALDHFLRHASAPSLRQIIATDAHGSVLTALRRSDDNSVAESLDCPPVIEVPKTPASSIYKTGTSLIAWQPVMAGSLLGWLKIVYSLDDIGRMQQQIWRQGLILCVAEVVIAIILFSLLMQHPINDLKTLSQFARNLPANRGATADVQPSVLEIKDLLESLNYASTELARIERELCELNQNLQQQVAEEVAKSREKDALLLQQARYQTLGELLVNIAHQWRQPLNSIGATIQELACELANNELTPEEALEKSNLTMTILQQLSHSLGSFRQLCQPTAASATFLPSVALASAVQVVRESYRLQGIEVSQEVLDELPIHGPQQELVQVLLNLFSNARDALQANQITNGIITGRISLASPRQIQLTVSDNGGGIPAQVQNTLFDPYTTTKFRAQGVGLGLFVTRQLIEQRFHGTITASNCGAGAQFSISIPVMQGDSL